MPGVTTITDPEARIVAKKKPPEAAEPPSTGKSYSFRASRSLSQRIDFVADRLQVDASNLIRLILAQNLQRYEEQANQIPPQAGEG